VWFPDTDSRGNNWFYELTATGRSRDMGRPPVWPFVATAILVVSIGALLFLLLQALLLVS
jgi:hypothetical protein